MLGLIRQYIPILVDISLITILFYRIYMLIRDTRIAKLAKLFTWLVGFVFLAQILQLYTVVWVLDRLWVWGVVLLIVIFQPEVKQIVNRITYRSRFFGSSPIEMRRFVADVADSTVRFATRHEGATLVIERDDPLDDLIDAGIRLEAIFSYDLLIAIYAENSPLRDGAVLIRNRRVFSASSLLPLPGEDKQNVSSLGFRHLSAITLSQQTDAVIIVVSAETGSISLVMHGRWQRNLNQERLEEALTDYLILGVDRAEAS